MFFFWGDTPEFLKSIYKIQPDSDHVEKFHGDRLRDLGESVAKKVTSRVKHKPVRNGGSGRLKNITGKIEDLYRTDGLIIKRTKSQNSAAAQDA